MIAARVATRTSLGLVALWALSCTYSSSRPNQPATYGTAPVYGSPPPYGAPPVYGAPQPQPAPGPAQPGVVYPGPVTTQGPRPAPAGAPAPVPAAPPAPSPVPQQAPAQVPQTTSLPSVTVGSFDADGSIAQATMRATAPSVIAELVAALPQQSASRVQGIPVSVIDDPKEVNAFAGCNQSGGAYMGITSPLLLIAARTSEAKAFDEIYGTSKYNELAGAIAAQVRAQKAVQGAAPGFLPLPQALDPRKLSRQKFLFDEQIAFVLGHELAHHYRGHTGCANGANQNAGLGPQDIGRVLSHAVPVFNQPNEIEADIQGTYNILDAGARRGQAGAWTEEGGIMTMNFFGRLQSLGVETVLLGFLMTHPAPQLRQPIIQNSAQQWRSNGGRAPTFPFPLPF